MDFAQANQNRPIDTQAAIASAVERARQVYEHFVIIFVHFIVYIVVRLRQGIRLKKGLFFIVLFMSSWFFFSHQGYKPVIALDRVYNTKWAKRTSGLESK